MRVESVCVCVCDCVSVWSAASDVLDASVSNGCVTATRTTEWEQRMVMVSYVTCILVCAQLPGCCLLSSVLGEWVFCFISYSGHFTAMDIRLLTTIGSVLCAPVCVFFFLYIFGFLHFFVFVNECIFVWYGRIREIDSISFDFNKGKVDKID